MKTLSFFKKTKKEVEEFSFPKKAFEIPEKSKLHEQSDQTNVELIINLETFLKECEKIFDKSASQYESLKKSEKSLTDKQKQNKEDYTKKNAEKDDDLKQLRSGYHKLRSQNEEYEKEIIILKKPVSKKVEDTLGEIHAIVIEFARTATCEADQMSKYEDALVTAETHFMSLENVLEDTQAQLETAITKFQSQELGIQIDKKKYLEQEDQISKYKLEFAQKAVELTKLEAHTREKSETTKDEFTEMSEKNQELDYLKNMLQVEKDTSHANVEAQKADITELNADLKHIKKENDNTHNQILSKDEELQKGKVMVKQIIKELNTQKRNNKEQSELHEKKDHEIETLKNQIEDLNSRSNYKDTFNKSKSNLEDYSNNNIELDNENFQNLNDKSISITKQKSLQNNDSEYADQDIIQQYSIEIQNLKDTIVDFEEKLREKEELIEKQNMEHEANKKKVRELETKRKYGLNEIQSLKTKQSEVDNSKKPPQKQPPLYEGKDLRNHAKNTPNQKTNNNFTFEASCTNLDFYLNNNTVTNIINASGLRPLIINPVKFDKFSKSLKNELQATYLKFVEMMPEFENTQQMKSFGIDIEKGLNISMQLVNGFAMYVNEKLEELNLKEKGTQKNSNVNCQEDVFKKRYSKI